MLEDQEHLPNFQDISVDQATMTTDDRWKTFFLYGYGFRSEANCARCPETAALCSRIPGMKTAFFSILAPGKHLPPHRGPYKGVLRYHLGLLIPEPAEQCGIRVDTETRHWAEGALADLRRHLRARGLERHRRARVSCCSSTSSARCRRPARWLNAAVLWAIAFSPFIGDAKRRHNDWEKRFEEIKARAGGVRCRRVRSPNSLSAPAARASPRPPAGWSRPARSGGRAAAQTAPSVPEPAKKSRHQPPGREDAATMRRSTPSGFCVG